MKCPLLAIFREDWHDENLSECLGLDKVTCLTAFVGSLGILGKGKAAALVASGQNWTGLLYLWTKASRDFWSSVLVAGMSDGLHPRPVGGCQDEDRSSEFGRRGALRGRGWLQARLAGLAVFLASLCMANSTRTNK